MKISKKVVLGTVLYLINKTNFYCTGESPKITNVCRKDKLDQTRSNSLKLVQTKIKIN